MKRSSSSKQMGSRVSSLENMIKINFETLNEDGKNHQIQPMPLRIPRGIECVCKKEFEFKI